MDDYQNEENWIEPRTIERLVKHLENTLLVQYLEKFDTYVSREGFIKTKVTIIIRRHVLFKENAERIKNYTIECEESGENLEISATPFVNKDFS